MQWPIALVFMQQAIRSKSGAVYDGSVSTVYIMAGNV